MNAQQTDKLEQDSIGALGGKANGSVANYDHVDELAHEITTQNHFARDPGGRLYPSEMESTDPPGSELP